jgi:hypothetical protein
MRGLYGPVMVDHSFATRAEADDFIAATYTDAVEVPVLSVFFNHPILLDRTQQVVLRIHDWSADLEDPVVNVDVLKPRAFLTDEAVAERVTGVLAHDGEPERAELREALAGLQTVFRAGLPPAWTNNADRGLIVMLDSVRSDLAAALATVEAVHDAALRDGWQARSAAGDTLAAAAKALDVSEEAIARAVIADRTRFRDL